MIEVIYRCSRSDCEEVVTVRVDSFDVDSTIAAQMPEGWGYDIVVVDDILHCPEHRTAAS